MTSPNRAGWATTGLIAAMLAAVGAVGLPAAPASGAEPRTLTFLTFNVCKSECESPAPDWQVRRNRVARVIAASGADVVGLQEATNWRVPKARTQWEDIENLVAPSGYVGPKVPAAFDHCDSLCVNSPRLLFKAGKVDQLTTSEGIPAAGYGVLGDIAPDMDIEESLRAFSWAYLEGPGTGPFLAVSIHMPNEKTAEAEAARRDVATRLSGWAAGLDAQTGLRSTTTVLLADLNSYDARQPRGAQAILRRSGWKDAFRAPERANITFSTINLTPDTRQFGGWPPRPRPFTRPATRIDYLFVQGPARWTEYEVMMWLNPDGTFDRDYQASDHQSVRGVLKF